MFLDQRAMVIWMMSIYMGLAVTQASDANAQGEVVYRLKSTHLECVIENVAVYLAMKEEVFIDAKDCPPEEGASIYDEFFNETPDIPFIDDLDSFLTLSHAHLECLAEINLPQESEILRYYPDMCRVEAE